MFREKGKTVRIRALKMHPDQKVVTQLPLDQLWSGASVISTTKVRDVGSKEIVELLRSGLVRFVVANVGEALNWVPKDEVFDFWKNEVRPHLADVEQVSLDDFPDSYCYFASEWKADDGEVIILLSKAH